MESNYGVLESSMFFTPNNVSMRDFKFVRAIDEHVFLFKWKEIGEDVVIKVLTWDLVWNWGVLDPNIPLEIEILAHLGERNIPGVITMYTWFRLEYTDDLPWVFQQYFNYHEEIFCIVMETSSSVKDLGYFCSTNSFNEAELKHVFSQVVNTVIDCANSGVYHLDLKTDNFLIDTNTLNVTLIDFGSAMFVRPDVVLDKNQLYATVDFFPPELFETQRVEVDKLTVWTLGWILYLMLSGNATPWDQQEGVKCITEFIVKKPIKIPEHLDTSIKQLLSKMLAKVPNDRIQLEEILDEGWFN